MYFFIEWGGGGGKRIQSWESEEVEKFKVFNPARLFRLVFRPEIRALSRSFPSNVPLKIRGRVAGPRNSKEYALCSIKITVALLWDGLTKSEWRTNRKENIGGINEINWNVQPSRIQVKALVNGDSFVNQSFAKILYFRMWISFFYDEKIPKQTLSMENLIKQSATVIKRYLQTPLT